MEQSVNKHEDDMEAKLRKLQVLITMPNDLEYFGDSVLPKLFSQLRDRIENFEVRDTDVWVASFPRSGIITVILFAKFYVLMYNSS